VTILTKLSDGRFGAQSSYHGPFASTGSTKYVPLLASDLRKLAMAKATLSSPGDNDWSQVGADVTLSGASDAVCLYAFYDSGNGRIGVATAQANGDFRYHAFNTATQSWDISDELIVQPAAATIYTTAPSHPCVAVAWRSNGDVTCIHNGYDSATGTNSSYRFIRTTSWGSHSKVQSTTGNVTGIASAYEGPTDSGTNDDQTLFLMQRSNGKDVRRHHFNESITVRSEEASANIDGANVVTGPGVKLASDVVYFPYVNSDDKVHVVSWDGTDGASTIGVTEIGAVGEQTAAFNGAGSAPFPSMGLVYDGTDVHLLYAAASDGDIYHNDDATTTGGTETKVVSGIVCHHLSASPSADNNTILLLYGDGDRVARFTKISIGATSAVSNYPLSAFLLGLRKLPVPLDQPPPGSATQLPAVEGETLWEQRWDACVLTPHSLSGGATWDYETRGAIGFDSPNDELCNVPGRLRQGGWPSGTFETQFDSVLQSNVVEIVATRTQFETLDQSNKKRNHTDMELHREGTPQSGAYDVYAWSRGGRGWPPQHEYKISLLAKLGSDFGRGTDGNYNEQWCIITQCFGFGDNNDGSRNPWMPLTVVSGEWQITLRGDSRDPLNGDKNYEYPNQAGAPGFFSLGPLEIDVWELFEISFRYDYRRTGNVGQGNGYCRVKRNGELKLDISGIQLGYNDQDGSTFSAGIYHYFSGTSNADSLSFKLGPFRFEKLA